MVDLAQKWATQAWGMRAVPWALGFVVRFHTITAALQLPAEEKKKSNG